MKKNVLYIGNFLKDKKHNASYMFTLGQLLTQEGYSLSYASGFTNKLLRLCHMIIKVARLQKQTNYVLIDTYSTQNFYYALLVSKLCAWFRLPFITILHGANLPERLKQ